jgi:hypothetical protein
METDVLLERVHHAPAERFSFCDVLRTRTLEREGCCGRSQDIAGGDVASDAGAGDSFDEDARRAGRKARYLNDAPDYPRPMQVSRRGLLLLAVALRDEQDDLVLGERCLDGGKGCRTPNEQGDDYIGENDNIPQRQDRNPVRRRDALVVPLKSLRQGLGFLLSPYRGDL